MPTSGKEENKCQETSPKRIKLDEVHSQSTNLSKILEREIRNEINVRRNDLELIEQRIYQTRQSLVKIRQGIVADYYKINSKGLLQMPPHPAVKDTFHGKRPAKRSNVCFNEEESDKNENSDISSAKDSVEANDEVGNAISNGCESKDLVTDQQIKKLPRYIPPQYRDKDVVQLFEPRGNVKKQKFRLSIVNVSKWIFNKEDGGATHKWTLYVKNSDPSVDISLFVSKITFFLHHSYKPNDVITVDYAPFKLTRRGWGEFPLRIQIHFTNSLDKPVDVIHQLKLDTTHSGLDTFGNETVVDVWAHVDENERDSQDNVEIALESSIKLEQEQQQQQQLQQEQQEHEQQQQQQQQLQKHDNKPLISPKIEPESSSSVKSSTYISDDYLSTSSLSQLSLQSLTAEISNDFLSDLFQENETKQKEEIERLKAEIENDCSNHKQNEVIKKESFVNCDDYSGFIENITTDLIFDGISGHEPSQTIANTSNEPILPEPLNIVTSESIFDKITTEQSNTNESTLSNPSQITVNTPSEFPQLEFLNSTEVLQKTEEVSTPINAEQTTEFISDNTIVSTDTYNPIECLNFINDEVIIESEHEDETVTKIDNTSASTNLTCKNFLESFVDTEILSSNEEPIKDDLLASTQNYVYEIPKILDTQQPIRIASILPEPKTMLDFSNSSLTFQPANQMRIIESLQKVQNSNNSTASISVNIYDNLNVIKSKSTAKKVFLDDVNVIKKMKISPVKKNHVKVNRKASSAGKLLKNKNEAVLLVNNGELSESRVSLANSVPALKTANLPVLNKHVTIADLNRIGSSDNLKQKLFIEMPDGKLREICSVKPANETAPSAANVNNKPIIVESNSLQNRKNPHLEAALKPKEIKVMKKMVLINNTGIKLMPSTVNQTKLNGQINQTQNLQKRLILPIKTVQKSNKSILRPAVVASGSSLPAVIKSTVNQTNSAQYIKLVTRNNLTNENIVIQRKVLPGESLLKKGNQVQSQEVVTVAQGLQQQVQGNAVIVQRPQVSTLSAAILSDKMLIERCPKESIEFAVNWLIRQFPLANEKAGNELYKMHHPYCAVDRVTFLRWPLAKQRASEWMRAKKIGALLLKICPDLKQWSTFQIIDWARLRGYTPLGIPLRCKYVNIDSSFKFTAPDLSSMLIKNEKFNAEEISIDVESEIEIDKKMKSTSSCDERLYISIDNKYKQLGNYIFKSCDKFGYHFYEEEILPDVIYPAAERALISVFNSVFDDLFRRSLNASSMRNGVMPAIEVTPDDVKLAILSRKEFDIFTNEGLG